MIADHVGGDKEGAVLVLARCDPAVPKTALM